MAINKALLFIKQVKTHLKDIKTDKKGFKAHLFE